MMLQLLAIVFLGSGMMASGEQSPIVTTTKRGMPGSTTKENRALHIGNPYARCQVICIENRYEFCMHDPRSLEYRYSNALKVQHDEAAIKLRARLCKLKVEACKEKCKWEKEGTHMFSTKCPEKNFMEKATKIT